MTYLDTHAAVMLYQGDTRRFSRETLQVLAADDDLRISPMAYLELEYLREIKRIKISASRIVQVLQADLGMKICDLPFAAVVARALAEKWTRDPFDRLIVAQAKLHNATLVTCDREILRRYAQAIC